MKKSLHIIEIRPDWRLAGILGVTIIILFV